MIFLRLLYYILPLLPALSVIKMKFKYSILHFQNSEKLWRKINGYFLWWSVWKKSCKELIFHIQKMGQKNSLDYQYLSQPNMNNLIMGRFLMEKSCFLTSRIDLILVNTIGGIAHTKGHHIIQLPQWKCVASNSYIELNGRLVFKCDESSVAILRIL